jgi:hypothetical protein
LTRLPTDALVRPKRYLEEHPNFLLRWASPEPPPRGRPRKHRQEIPSEEEGRS